ncbi:MAG: transposase [Streptococcus sp.]|nr:transposase [Streptococcus sp.]
MDNASYHKSKKTKEAIQELGFSALFTVPYSPELNLAEIAINFIKRKAEIGLKLGK